MHWCGGIDDYFLLPLYLLMLLPGFKIAVSWLRQKFSRKKKACCDCHE